ncbi:MAG: oligosaccharide flippase family protein, partial [Draconibacterium sp.]|nr:oligosaccharide flippase family protein [Draconibacterium sp.]
TSRLFPYFRDKEKAHNGYLFIALLVAAIGFLLFIFSYLIFSPGFIESNIEKSKLFADHAYLLIPLTFFMLLYSVLDVYNKVLYNAVLGTFLQEFFQRILIFVVVVIYAFGLINTQQLIIFFVIAASAKGIYLLIYLLIKGEFSLRPKFDFVTKKLRKEIFSVAMFSTLTGVGGSLVFNIDKIVINQTLGLSSTGVYTVGFFFGILVLIPSRPLLRISGTLVADAWKRNDKKYISDIYSRSCINQFIIAAFLFGGIWINIDNILVILGPEYEGVKWVIFFIGIANVIEMATGGNAQVIAYSKYYRASLYFLIILMVLVIVLMLLLIPVWGIVGAAIAIAVSIFANNLMRYLFILWKFKMQPFTVKFLLVPVVFLAAYFLSSLLTQLQLIPDILMRSVIFTIVFGGLILWFRVSDDVDGVVRKHLRRE